MSKKKQRRILIIDDEVTFTRLLQLNLEQLGAYTVRVENQGTQALAAAREFHPDMIFCDVIMPEIGGGEVAAQIHADAALAQTPIVFLTAVVSKQEASARGGMIGGHPYLAKPATVEEVVHCIEQQIKG